MLVGVISGVEIPPGGALFVMRWGVVYPVLLWVVSCDVISVVCSVMLLLSKFRTSLRRTDLCRLCRLWQTRGCL